MEENTCDTQLTETKHAPHGGAGAHRTLLCPSRAAAVREKSLWHKYIGGQGWGRDSLCFYLSVRQIVNGPVARGSRNYLPHHHHHYHIYFFSSTMHRPFQFTWVLIRREKESWTTVSTSPETNEIEMSIILPGPQKASYVPSINYIL